MSKKCDLTGVKGMTGNNVPKSKHRTRRTFLPNLKEVYFKSDILGTLVLKVTANVLRTINKYGGIDAFLVNSKSSKLSENGCKIKRKIKKSLIKKGTIDNYKINKVSKKPKTKSIRKLKLAEKKK